MMFVRSAPNRSAPGPPREPIGIRRLRISTNCRLLASLQLAFKHREVVHGLLHAGAGRSRELLGRGVIHRCGGTAELVSAPGQRASLAQELGDRFRGRRIRTSMSLSAMPLILRCTTTDSRPIEPRHQCRKWIPLRDTASAPLPQPTDRAERPVISG
jgi:hypothetical protein